MALALNNTRVIFTSWKRRCKEKEYSQSSCELISTIFSEAITLRSAMLLYSFGEVPNTKQETIRQGLWSCSICTYDNDESMTSCDICGVVRRPLANTGTSNSSKTCT